MTTPIFDQVTEIHAWTDRQRIVNQDYRLHPFAATHVARCPGTCGGWIAIRGTEIADYSIPCANKHHSPLPPLRPPPPVLERLAACLHCDTPLNINGRRKQFRYCSRSCAMRHRHQKAAGQVNP